MILDDIVEIRKVQLEKEKNEIDFIKVEKKAMKLQKTTDKNKFYYAIKGKEQISVIAEVKKASPSKGIISKDFRPLEIAQQYEELGASAVSCLTEEAHFMGNNKYLKKISNNIQIPVLRKDFIIDEYQIYHAKILGASAILLIAAILDKNTISKFLEIANSIHMDCLVEVHNEEELEKVLATEAEIIGINCRNLKDFTVSLQTTEKLAKYIPNDKVLVSESGIHTGDDIKYLKSCNIDAILVGESLMKTNSISDKMGEFLNA